MDAIHRAVLMHWWESAVGKRGGAAQASSFNRKTEVRPSGVSRTVPDFWQVSARSPKISEEGTEHHYHVKEMSRLYSEKEARYKFVPVSSRTLLKRDHTAEIT